MPKEVDYEKEFLPDLRRVVQILGRAPTLREYNKLGTYNAVAGKAKVGSWKKVLSSIGLELKGRKKDLTDEELLSDLETIIKKEQRPIEELEYKKLGGKYAYKTFCIRFASAKGKADGWKKANEIILQRCGILIKINELANFSQNSETFDICHQKKKRDQEAINNPKEALPNLQGCFVKEISFQEAKPIILKYEWLESMGWNPITCYGLFSSINELIGVACFGKPGGQAAQNICGDLYKNKAICLQRGACVHWAPKNAASFLITESVRKAYKKYGWSIFWAYSDESAGEIGTVYQACNWKYLGQGVGHRSKIREEFLKPNGKKVSSRALRNAKLTKAGALQAGWIPLKVVAKHKYVWFEGSRKQRNKLKKLCKFPFKEYPKRKK